MSSQIGKEKEKEKEKKNKQMNTNTSTSTSLQNKGNPVGKGNHINQNQENQKKSKDAASTTTTTTTTSTNTQNKEQENNQHAQDDQKKNLNKTNSGVSGPTGAKSSSSSSSSRSSSAPPTEHISNITLGNKQPNTSTYRNQQYVPINTIPQNATLSHAGQTPIPAQEYQKKANKDETESQGQGQSRSNFPHAQNITDVQMQSSYQHGAYTSSVRGGRHSHTGRGGGRSGPQTMQHPYNIYQQSPMNMPYYAGVYSPHMQYVPPYGMLTGAYPQSSMPPQSNPSYMMQDPNRVRGVPGSSTTTNTPPPATSPPATFTPIPKKVLDIIDPRTNEKVVIQKPKQAAAATPATLTEKYAKPTNEIKPKSPTKTVQKESVAVSKVGSSHQASQKDAVHHQETIIFGDIAVSKISTQRQLSSEVTSTNKPNVSNEFVTLKSPKIESKKEQKREDKTEEKKHENKEERKVEKKEEKKPEKKHDVKQEDKKQPINNSVASPKSQTVTKVKGPEKRLDDEKKLVKENTSIEETNKLETSNVDAPINNVYSVDFLLGLRENYKELVLKEGEEWPCMDIINEGPSRRSGRGGGNWNKNSSGGGGRDWSRSQKNRGGRGGGGASNKRARNLNRSDNRWVARKAVSNLEACKKLVQGILNKMTREKFDPLSTQLCEMNMESLQMLREVIKLIFAKAINEPHFCDMYADLCVKLQDVWKVWGFLQVAQNDDEDKFYWTTITDKDAEVVGPFPNTDEILENIENGDFIPTDAPSNLTICDLHVRDGYLIKIWKQPETANDSTEGSEILYWSREKVETLEGDNSLHGPFSSRDEAYDAATKTTAFKRILLNSCQEEFEKDNIYEELEKATAEKKAKGELTPEMEEEVEEKKHILKFRMLGNIRFIGELYKKGMLQERIMHTCIMKLLDLKPVAVTNPKTGTLQQTLTPIEKDSADEEKLESCCRLLTTMGKTLDNASPVSASFMNKYFDYIATLSVDKKYSSRIRFTLQDLIELRANKWQPRRKELQQKKLSEIRKDQEKEQKTAAANMAAAAAKDMGSYRGNRYAGNSSMRGNTGSGLGAGNYHRGDRNDQGGRSQNNSKLSSTTSGRNSINLGKEKSMAASNDMSKLSSSTERQQQFKPNSGFSSMSSRKPSHSNVKKASETKPEVQDTEGQTDLSDEDKKKLESLLKSNVEEFNSSKDKEEMSKCLQVVFQRYNAPDSQQVYIHYAFQWAMEKSRSNQRDAYLNYIETVYNENYVPEDIIAECFGKYMLEGTELWVDIPKMHENIGHFIYQLGNKEGSVFNIQWIITGGRGCLSHNDLSFINEEGSLCQILAVYLNDAHKTKKIEKEIEKLVEGIFATCKGREPSYAQGLKLWIHQNQLEDVIGELITRHLDQLADLIDGGKIAEAIAHYSTITDDIKESLLLRIPLFYILIDCKSLSTEFLAKMNISKSKELYISALMIYRYYTENTISTACDNANQTLNKLTEAKILTAVNAISPSSIEAKLKTYLIAENDLQEFLKIFKN